MRGKLFPHVNLDMCFEREKDPVETLSPVIPTIEEDSIFGTPSYVVMEGKRAMQGRKKCPPQQETS